jgi:cytochrome c-type biogenesis protein CcmH
MTIRILAVLAFLLANLTPVLAVQPDEVLPDPAMEQRARDLSAKLRCLVCQNQSIDDSDAPLARDLRVLLRERLQKGDSDADVIAYLVDRYGEFILLKPRVGLHTFVLWFGPFVLLAIGGIIIVRMRKGATVSPVEAPLSDAESARLKDLIDSDK